MAGGDQEDQVRVNERELELIFHEWRCPDCQLFCGWMIGPKALDTSVNVVCARCGTHLNLTPRLRRAERLGHYPMPSLEDMERAKKEFEGITTRLLWKLKWINVACIASIVFIGAVALFTGNPAFAAILCLTYLVLEGLHTWRHRQK